MDFLVQSSDIHETDGRHADWLSGEKDFAECCASASHRSIADFAVKSQEIPYPALGLQVLNSNGTGSAGKP